MNASPSVRLCMVLLLALAGGCAVGPDYQRPPVPGPPAYPAAPLEARADSTGEQGVQRLVPGADIPAQWWTLFRSPELNTLVEEALKANPDLKAAQAGLRVAMENLSAQRGAYLPTLSGTVSASRNQNSSVTSPFLASNALLYTLYEAQVNATWTLDVFGGNRRAVEAQRAQADAERYQLESTHLTITTNVVVAALQEASLRAQIAATEDIIRSDSEALDIFRRQYSLGQIAGADLAAQEAAVAQVEQTLPPLEKLLAQQRDLIAALTGRLPSEPPAETFDFSKIELPIDVPISLPSKLVEQRPDILIAEANLRAASAEVGVAEANQFPNITLTANPGSIATETSRLFEPGSAFWSVGAGLTQPLFAGGTLYHKTRAAKAAYDQAAAQYQSAVLAAFENVADSLYAVHYDAALLKSAAASERAAATSLDIAKRQVELGSVAYLSLLTAEKTYQQARIALLQAQAGRYADTAALLQALGGGWWNRPKGVRE